MLRTKLSQFLSSAAAKVAENQTPEYVKAQLKQRREALIVEINGYRDALACVITPK
jgi:hypothetical protein